MPDPAGVPSIDICLVAGARPSLLAKTLESFHSNLIASLNISRCFVNIDPFGGAESDRRECCRTVLAYFPDAKIFQPSSPNFAAAVQRLWQSTSSQYVLHLEDDWQLLEKIDTKTIFSHFDDRTRALKFLAKEHHHDITRRGVYDVGYIRRKFFGITLRRIPYHRHGTSPGFFDGDFVRIWAAMMDTNLDPEKQVRPGVNVALFEYARNYQSRFLASATSSVLIEDIGRVWRLQHRIKKQSLNGLSVWKKN